MDEEVVLLEEQLASAHADVERLQALLTEAEEATTRAASETEAVRNELDALRGELASAVEDGRTAAQRYREAVLAAEPGLPADLVAGESVADIEDSVAKARQTVAQVRQHLEQQAQAMRVPPGAPVRGAPDYSSLSPAEKIRIGLQQT